MLCLLLQAVFEQINAQQRPDLVRQTDRPHKGYKAEETQTRFRQIIQAGIKEYVTGENCLGK